MATEAESERDAPDAYEDHRPALDVLDVLNWDEEDRRTAFTRSAMKRAKLPQMKRNALIVAGNRLRERDDPELRRRIEAIAADPEEPDLVRRTADDVLRWLHDEPNPDPPD
jgi:epoxyqueuosine reductase QueG